MSKPGDLSTVKQADPLTKEMCNVVKSQVDKLTGGNLTFEAQSYSTQVVKGMNYFIKRFLASSVKMSKPGDLSTVKQADPLTKEMCNVVKSQVDKLTGGNLTFEAQSYSTQVVKGMNYFIKASTSPGVYVHLRVYQRDPEDGSNITLQKILFGQTLDDPIIFF